MRINKLLKTKHKKRVRGIKTNSKEIKKGDIFVCGLGNIDKTKYLDEAINRGCSFIITNNNITNDKVIVVNDVNQTLKEILDKFYKNPLNQLKLIGITGTDGKTTTSTILKDMVNGACIGTNGLIIDEKVYPLSNTTPSLDKVYECFNKVIKAKKKHVFMEVSSEAYLTNRIPYLSFNIGVFTNITKEHLDKHKSFIDYFNCKMNLLKNSDIVIINRDSHYFHKIRKINRNYYTYGTKKSDLTIRKYRLFLDHTEIYFTYNHHDYFINSPLIGKFNVYNLMASILTILLLGYDMKEIEIMILNIKKIMGRDEIIEGPNYKVLLDHAHTINATRSILMFANKFKKNRIITVLGCAGNRYRDKRKVIGKIVSKYSDVVIFTSDDPRDEDPNQIIDDMTKLVRGKYYRIIDRKEAIRRAILIARTNDLILVLGRGRDEVMHLNGYNTIHNDYEVVKNCINND